MCSTDSIAQTALTAAYMYSEIERERRREHRLMKVAADEFKIGNYFGFEQGRFRPSETSKYVVESGDVYLGGHWNGTEQNRKVAE